MSDRAAYEYRAFLLQVSGDLSQDDVRNIGYLEQMQIEPNSKPITVLTQLEMRGKLSSSKPDNLVKLLKKIMRHDLAKKVRDFAKKQRKEKSGRSPAATSPLEKLDQSIVNLRANLQVTLIQCRILLEQMENVREAAEEAGQKRVEEVVAEAHSLVSDQLQRKLRYASGLAAEQDGLGDSCRERSDSGGTPSPPSSPPSSFEFDTTSLEPAPSPSALGVTQPGPGPQKPGSVRLPVVPTINNSELKAAVGKLKSNSLPRARGSPSTAVAKPRQQENGGTKQPLVPPTRHRLTRNTTTAENDVLAGPNGETNSRGKVKPVVPGSEQTVLGTTQLITGRLTNEKPPPPPPPKPKIKYLDKETSDQQLLESDDDSLYADPDTLTCTDDSGFADSNDFLKVALQGQYQLPHTHHTPPHHAPPHHAPPPSVPEHGGACYHVEGFYAPLDMNGIQARYYKSLQREGIQEVHYAPQVPPTITPSNQSGHYMNLPQK